MCLCRRDASVAERALLVLLCISALAKQHIINHRRSRHATHNQMALLCSLRLNNQFFLQWHMNLAKKARRTTTSTTLQATRVNYKSCALHAVLLFVVHFDVLFLMIVPERTEHTLHYTYGFTYIGYMYIILFIRIYVS